MFKKFILAVILAAVSSFVMNAQTEGESGTGAVEHAGIETVVDSALVGYNIFSTLPNGATVKQSSAVRKALEAKVAADASKTISGYRIRLYFASDKNAREASASVISRFNRLFPHIQAYRSYSSPNYKVTVGNFRTRVEAEYLLRKLKGDFPDAFIVREKFKYPSIGMPDTSAAEQSFLTL